MRRTIGIYGGSFNPIHNGHIALARQFITALSLDKVWFVVSPQNPFKVNDQLLDDDKRLEMVRVALADEPQMDVCDIEFYLPKPSYMWNTLQRLSTDFPETEFVLLIGGDNWSSFHRWYRAADILKHYHVAVYPRRGEHLDEASLPEHVTMVRAALLDISSTAIRQRLAAGQSIEGLVPAEVARLIAREHLYALFCSDPDFS